MTILLRLVTRADIELLEGWGRDLYNVEQKFELGLRYLGEAFWERDVEGLSSPNAHYLIAELGGDLSAI